MFAYRVIPRLSRTAVAPGALGSVRHQSSSSSSAKLLQAKTQKIQQQLHKTIQQKQQPGVPPGHAAGGGSPLGKGANGSGSSADGPLDGSSRQKLRKGFSTVDKVPSTVNLEPRDVLLDKLYQGYNPLLSPIKPKVKKTSPKILVNIYEDLAFDDDGFENDDAAGSGAADSLVGPKLQISKYIFDKNPQMEAKLKELDADAKEAKGRREKHAALFSKRPAAAGKRGRVRLQFKKNMGGKKDGDEQ